MSVRAGFGAMGDNYPQDFRKVYDVTLEGDTTGVTVDFEPESIYLMFATAWTIADGKFYGSRIAEIITPAPEAFGTVANTATNAAATTNQGFNHTMNANGTMTWKCSATTRRARTRIYKVG